MKKTNIKKYIVVFLCMLLFLSDTVQLSAHQSAAEHDKELEAVLFVDGYSSKKTDEIKNNITALEYASNLTIDQSQGNGEKKYVFLKAMKIKGLPRKFSDIDYTYDIVTGTKIVANSHRKYTHQGWNRKYQNKEVKKFWSNRRKVLISTVDHIFKFDDEKIFGTSAKCDSLAGIIYYTHILGDILEADDYKKIVLLTKLSGSKEKEDDMVDVIPSLRKYCDILFKDNQFSKIYYDEFMKELDRIEEKSDELVNSVGGINTDEEFEEYHKCAEELLDAMMKYIPHMLEKEDFFKEVFY